MPVAKATLLRTRRHGKQLHQGLAVDTMLMETLSYAHSRTCIIHAPNMLVTGGRAHVLEEANAFVAQIKYHTIRSSAVYFCNAHAFCRSHFIHLHRRRCCVWPGKSGGRRSVRDTLVGTKEKSRHFRAAHKIPVDEYLPDLICAANMIHRRPARPESLLFCPCSP